MVRPKRVTIEAVYRQGRIFFYAIMRSKYTTYKSLTSLKIAGDCQMCAFHSVLTDDHCVTFSAVKIDIGFRCTRKFTKWSTNLRVMTHVGAFLDFAIGFGV